MAGCDDITDSDVAIVCSEKIYNVCNIRCYYYGRAGMYQASGQNPLGTFRWVVSGSSSVNLEWSVKCSVLTSRKLEWSVSVILASG